MCGKTNVYKEVACEALSNVAGEDLVLYVCLVAQSVLVDHVETWPVRGVQVDLPACIRTPCCSHARHSPGDRSHSSMHFSPAADTVSTCARRQHPVWRASAPAQNRYGPSADMGHVALVAIWINYTPVCTRVCAHTVVLVICEYVQNCAHGGGISCID